MGERELFRQAADYAADFLETLDERPVRAHTDEESGFYGALGGSLPEEGLGDRAILDSLVEASDPGLVASQSARYFGFVVGGALPVATAADWLATAWDVNAGGWALGPSAMVVEEVARGWLAELLGLPRTRRPRSSPAARWLMSPRWPPPGSTCSPPSAGTWRGTVLRAARRSASSSARSAM